ncbi:MAG: hypothetical protein JSV03_13575 [Planctomycetota bacterium]|nr:MAG: hypothetical protein JSV03_13575 [Planctomycetota bacterium]
MSRLAKSNPFAWTISIILHAIVFLALYQIVFQESAQPKKYIIPEARLVAGADAKLPQPTAPLKLSRQPLPDSFSRPKIQEPPITAVTLDTSSISALTERDKPDTSIPLTSAASVSTLNTGPASSFFGIAGNAYKVVYVVDVSASLMIYIDEIVREMRESIRALLPTQRFHIVLAKPRKVVEFSPRRLVPAIGKYKTRANSFIDTITGIPQPGKADPIEAMKRAFAVRPQLIYFLTDGDYPDIQSDLELTLQQLNTNQEVKITTIGFDPSPNPRTLLERIARDHGGNFRMVVLK